MAALSAGSLTYTVLNARRLGNSKVFNKVKIAFTSGQTYPTGGIAIATGTVTVAAGGVVGCPNAIESLVIADGGTAGYVFNYNTSTGKLMMFSVNVAATAAGVTLTEIASTVTPGALNIFADIVGW